MTTYKHQDLSHPGASIHVGQGGHIPPIFMKGDDDIHGNFLPNILLLVVFDPTGGLPSPDPQSSFVSPQIILWNRHPWSHPYTFQCCIFKQCTHAVPSFFYNDYNNDRQNEAFIPHIKHEFFRISSFCCFSLLRSANVSMMTPKIRLRTIMITMKKKRRS